MRYSIEHKDTGILAGCLEPIFVDICRRLARPCRIVVDDPTLNSTPEHGAIEGNIFERIVVIIVFVVLIGIVNFESFRRIPFSSTTIRI